MSLSAHDMRKSLDYNNSLKRKKNPFKKDWGVGAAWQQDYSKYENNTPHSSHYDKDPRTAERRKIRPQRKSGSNGLAAFGAIAIILMALGMYMALEPIAVADRSSGSAAKSEEDAEQARQYHYFITAGDDWVAKNQWGNAVFEYKKALEYFPRDYAGHVRLATAYTYACKHEQRYCGDAGALIDKLLAQKPESAELYLLRASYYLTQGYEAAAAKDFAKADELTE